MSSDFDYKKYSLEKLQEWVHDAMDGDASPHEIYSAIHEIVREDYYYHKDRVTRAGELLALLNSERPVADVNMDKVKHEYLESMYPDIPEDGSSVVLDYDAAGAKFPRVCDKDDPSPECQKSWNDFWEEQYYPEEYTKAKIEANSAHNDGWTQEYYQKIVDKYEDKQDKVKKWVLPVEECKDADTDETEYFVSFPDDLLEAANLKEGDQVEWVDQGDGSYRIEKVSKAVNYREMTAAGYTMTADGFWIKE